MKIKGYLFDEKKYIKKLLLISSILFILGIVIGAIYCISLSPESDNSVYKYLTSYFLNAKNNEQNIEILKNSLFDYAKILLILYFSSLVRPGIILIGSTVILRGFISGFTTSSAIKYFGIKGMLIPLASFISEIIYIPALIIMAALSINYCLSHYKSNKNNLSGYTLLSFCCFTIFCVASVSDAFITTTFMKYICKFFT